MEIKSGKDVNVEVMNDEYVTFTKMNHISEIMYMSRMNTKSNIKKISHDEYVDLKTGEIKQFELSETRADNVNSLKQTFKKLRYLINNNFVGNLNEFFITLTFSPNEFGWRPSVSDTEYLAKCMKVFIQRLKRKYGQIEFVRVLEPHEDGHAHYHMLIRFDDYENIYIANSELNALWGHGFVRINSLKDVDNIGAYVSAYFSDIELNEQTGHDKMMTDNDSTVIVEKGDKKYIKGGRLKYYPVGVQIFNKSKGLKYPDRKRMTYLEAKEKAGSIQPTFQKSVILSDLDDDFELKLRYEYFNSKR